MLSDKITVFGDSIPKGYTTKDNKIERLSISAVDIIEKHYGINIDNRSCYGQTLDKLYKRGIVDKYIEELNPGVKTPRFFASAETTAITIGRRSQLLPTNITTRKRR